MLIEKILFYIIFVKFVFKKEKQQNIFKRSYKDFYEKMDKKEKQKTIITLKESYLNTLSVGNHYLTLYYLDGEASAVFEIEASLSDDENKKPDDSTQLEDENKQPDTSQPEDENKKPDAPQSGDKNSLLLWITLLLISGFGTTGKIVYSAKKK